MRGIPRHFTPAEDAVIMRAHAGEISMNEAGRIIDTGHRQMAIRLHDLGLRAELPAPKYKKRYKKKPLGPEMVPGWFAIAHKANRHWVEMEGAPITIRAARLAVDAGRATMAHKRVDGGWDLMFKVLG